MTTHTSHFVKTVCLQDWWLTKAVNNSSGNTVAVAGSESAGRQAQRVFFSAPIVKSHDLFTLRTADGIFVLLKGFINKKQTCENGFSEEVCKKFLIGFPSNWEEIAERCFRQGTCSDATADADLPPDCANRPTQSTEEANITVAELQDDQNINSLEEDPISTAQNHKNRYADAYYPDKDACTNIDSRVLNTSFMGKGVRYNLRNRKVPNIAVSGGINSGTRTKTFAAIRSVSISCEASVGNNLHKAKEAEASHRHDNMEPIPQDAAVLSTIEHADVEPTPHNAGKEKNLISNHSHGGKPSQSKKRSRTERSSLLKQSFVNADASAKTRTPKGKGKKPLETQNRSTRDVDEVESRSSYLSKKGRKQRSILTRTTADNKNCHDSARPTLNDPKTTCTPKGKEKKPTSPRALLRTSRSGRKLLPVMEFWRNQLPIYDADHGISGIMEGSTLLKVGIRPPRKSKRIASRNIT